MTTPRSFETIDQLRQFEPARSYLWDLSFSFIPFNNSQNSGYAGKNLSSYIPTKVVAWIPADTLNRTISIIQSSDITTGQNNYRFPSGTTSKDITINFIDDYKNGIRDWIEAWMEYVILCNGNGVNFLSNIVDTLTIVDLLPTHEVNKTTKLNVYPDGPLQDTYTSDSGIKVYSQNFVVCGKAE